MAVIRCPQCDVPLTNDEIRGGTCPACKTRLPSQDSFREDLPRRESFRGDYDVDDDRPVRGITRSHGRGADAAAWGTVGSGLTIMLIAYALWLATGVVTAIVQIASERGPGRDPVEDPFAIFSVCMGCFVIVLYLAYLVGMIMCLRAPEGRSWMVGALTCMGLAIVLVVLAATVSGVVLKTSERVFDPKRSSSACSSWQGFLCCFLQQACLA